MARGNRSTARRVLLVGLAVVVVGVGGIAWYAHGYVSLAAGYVAKITASAALLAGRDLTSIRAEELADFGWIDVAVERERGRATASVWGVVSRVAVVRPGIGCTLLPVGAAVDDLVDVDAPSPIPPSAQPTDALARGVVQAAADVDEVALRSVLAEAFAEPDDRVRRRTRAVLVVHRDQLVAERYAPGFDASTLFHGWSMTKSLVNALLGTQVLAGQQRVDAPVSIPAWRDADDPRRGVTVDELLRMSSGLEFYEEYSSPDSGVIRMLFAADDMAGFAAAHPLAAPRDTAWSYSSGTSVILSRVFVDTAGGPSAALQWMRDRLCAPIGMRSLVIEVDARGTPVGSSYGWATGRDWARFGLLYLRDGVWNGARLLPEGWCAYSVKPTPAADGEYGAHFWLNAPDANGRRAWDGVPEDAYWAAGHEGQFVVVVPSRDVVVVRLGMSNPSNCFRMGPFVREVLRTLDA